MMGPATSLLWCMATILVCGTVLGSPQAGVATGDAIVPESAIKPAGLSLMENNPQETAKTRPAAVEPFWKCVNAHLFVASLDTNNDPEDDNDHENSELALDEQRASRGKGKQGGVAATHAPAPSQKPPPPPPAPDPQKPAPPPPPPSPPSVEPDYDSSFKLFAPDGNIDSDKLEVITKDLGLDISAQDLDGMIDAVDSDGTSDVDADEFAKQLDEECWAKGKNEGAMEALFQMFDADHDKVVKAPDIVSECDKLGVHLEIGSLGELLSQHGAAAEVSNARAHTSGGHNEHQIDDKQFTFVCNFARTEMMTKTVPPPPPKLVH